MHPIVVVKMPHEISIATSRSCGAAFVAELPHSDHVLQATRPRLLPGPDSTLSL
jgi:hypothetical protein